MDFGELNTTADQAAQRLLGCVLERTIGKRIIRVRIVETEAYDQNDPGSHTFRGRTPRNEIMFEQAGYLYVYFIYGMHYCCNVVTGPDGYGEAALIRAVEPLDGIDIMEMNRAGHGGASLTNGPSKLCSALAITRELNGHYLDTAPLILRMHEPLASHHVVTTTRIGLKKGADTPWRFYIRDNPYVSRQARELSSNK